MSVARLARLLGPWQDRPGPLYRRVTTALTEAVLDGRLAPGERLPSHRHLADGLGLSRSTAVRVYEEVRSAGLLESRPRSGNYVQLPEGITRREGPWLPATGRLSHPVDLSKAATRVDDAVLQTLSLAATDLMSFKDRDGYDVLGLLELREAVARRFEQRGIPTTSEEILITSGAQQGIDLVTRLLVRPGDTVALESPAYAGLIDRLRQTRANLVSLDISETPWDIDRFSDVVRRSQARIAFVTPDFHNPTGRLMPQHSRDVLAEVVAREKITLVVDETNVEINLTDAPMPAPLAASAPARSTITVGSLSKCVWAGLRIGWIRTNANMIQALANLKLTSILSVPLLEQLASIRILADDAFDQFLASRRPRLVAQRDLVLATARELGMKGSEPLGGLSCWAALPTGSSTVLAQHALQRQLLLLPGTRLSPDGVLDRFLRLPYSLPLHELQGACAALERAWESIRGISVLNAYPDPVV